MDSPGVRRRVLVWLARILVAVLCLFLFYLGAANLALKTDVLRPLTNRKPEKLLVEWRSGWTVLPGVIHIDGLRIRGQTRKMQWQCRVEKGTFRISLLRLFGKTVRVSRGRGTGFEFCTRGRIPPDREPPETARFTPEIEGLSNPPDPAPETLYPRKKDPPKNPWSIDVSNVVFEGPADLWFQRLRIRGEGHVGGGVRFQIRSSMEITRALLDLGAATVTADGDVLADDVDLTIDGSLSPFVLRETKGFAIMGHFAGTIDLVDGTIPDLRALNVFLPEGGGMKILSGDVRLNTRISAPTAKDASGNIEVDVEDALFVLADSEIGGNVTLRARLERGDLMEGRYDLGETTISFDDMILPDPKRERREEKEEDREERAEEHEATETEEERARREAKEHRREEKAEKKAAKQEAKEEAPGEEEEEEDEGWWAKLRVNNGSIDLGQPGDPLGIDTSLQFEMKDTRPLLTLFLSKPTEGGDKKKMPAWAKLAPNIKDLEGDAHFLLGPEGTIIDDVVITSEKLDMMARLKIGGGKTVGQMYIRFTIFHLGIDMGAEKKKMRWSKPKEWFIEQPEFLEPQVPPTPEGHS